MDHIEAAALGQVCGVDVRAQVTPYPTGPAFAQQLAAVIDRYNLQPFFTRHERHAMNGIDVRPAAVNYRTDEVNAEEMREWRRAFRALLERQQIMVATIVWLYRGGPDDLWLKRMPCHWHAAEAIAVLNQTGAIADWGRLVALYPGW
jgi:hypothetical protein